MVQSEKHELHHVGCVISWPEKQLEGCSCPAGLVVERPEQHTGFRLETFLSTTLVFAPQNLIVVDLNYSTSDHGCFEAAPQGCFPGVTGCEVQLLTWPGCFLGQG